MFSNMSTASSSPLLLQGAAAVLSGGTIDVLCHAAVRARNTGVLLAACRSAAGLAALRDLEGQVVAVEAVSCNLYWTAPQ
jgi:hypothetical protein